MCYCKLCKASLAVVAYRDAAKIAVKPNELYCHHCHQQEMCIGRLASKMELQCWLSLLRSRPACKAPVQIEVVWPDVMHSFRPSLIVDPVDVLSGLDKEVLEEAFTRPAVIHQVDKPLAEERPVEVAARLIQQGVYFQCNFQPGVEQSSQQCMYLAAIKTVRPGRDVCEESRGIIDPIRTSLAMFGREGLGTGFHVDRSQAENIAFPVVCLLKGKKATNKPKPKLQPLVLAVWWFVHPYVAADFGEHIKEVFGHAAGIAGFKPQPQHYSDMYAFGDAHTIAGRSSRSPQHVAMLQVGLGLLGDESHGNIPCCP
ncbi:TPA: hypothetical protein ACH3X2_002559 [Trebouxia sp. C0005]